MEKYRVTLTAQERADLQQLVAVGKGAARKLTHARILLLADAAAEQRRTDEGIVAALGLQAALDPRPQPPRPDKIKIKGDVEQKLVELACGDPPQGRCHWTLQLLADRLVVLGLLDTVSVETVRQALKKTTLNRGSAKPGASRRAPTPSSSGGWKT